MNKIPIYYTVLSLWLAKELERRGFECAGTGENIKKKEFSVFYFYDSNELRQAIDQIQKEKQNAKAKVSKSKNSNHRQ